MQVSIQLVHQTQSLLFDNVSDTVQRGGMFCVILLDGTVHKFPLVNIVQVTEYRLIEMPTTK